MLLRLDKMNATKHGHIESVQFAVDKKVGNIVVLDGLAEGEREIYAVKADADIKTSDRFLLHTTVERVYEGKDHEDNFVLKAGRAGRAHHLVKGDIFTLAKELVDTTVAPAVGKFLVPQAGSDKLAVADAPVADAVIVLEIIEIEKFLMADGTRKDAIVVTVKEA